MKKILVLAAMLAAVMSSVTTTASASIVVAYWNQNSNALPGGGFGFLADAFPQAADVGSGSLTVGGGITNETLVNGNGDTVYRWLPSFAGTTVNAPDGVTSGGSIGIQGGTDTANNGAHFQFAIDMTGLQDLTVSYATQRTSTGFTTQTWFWSANGTDFSDFQTVSDAIENSFVNTGVITLNPIADLNNVSTAFLRVVFTGATASSGNNRLDNITFSATAVPEPSALLLVGSVLGAGFLRRRRS